MSFMMCMFQIQEEDLGKEYGDKENTRVQSIVNFFDKLNKRN